MCWDKTCFIQCANVPATSLIFFAQHTHTHTHTRTWERAKYVMCTRIYDNCTQTLHQNEKHFFYNPNTCFAVCYHICPCLFSWNDSSVFTTIFHHSRLPCVAFTASSTPRELHTNFTESVHLETLWHLSERLSTHGHCPNCRLLVSSLSSLVHFVIHPLDRRLDRMRPPFQGLHWWKELRAAFFAMTALTALMKRRTVCDLLSNSNDCTDEKENCVWPPFQRPHWWKGELCVTSFPIPMTALMKRRIVCDLLSNSNDRIDEKENGVWPLQWRHWWKGESSVCYLLSSDGIDEKKNGLCAASFPVTAQMYHQNTSLALSVMFFLVTKVHSCLHRSARPIFHFSLVCSARARSSMPMAPKTLFTQFAAREKILFRSLNHLDKFTLTKHTCWTNSRRRTI